MDSEGTDRSVSSGDGGDSARRSPVSCSICLEAVVQNGSRSMAMLQCGHEFHLDCIGSAFNVKGLMQCPNCRKIETGQWLFANSCRSYPELGMDEWTHDEDLYELGYAELPLGIQWCPFGGLARVSSSLEERDLSSTAHHDLLRRYAIFAEQRAASLPGHACPYIAYFQHLHPPSHNFDGIPDVPTFSHRWHSLSGPSDISVSHTVTTMDLPYHTWDHPPPSLPSISSADHAAGSSANVRSTRSDSGALPRAGSFFHPLLLSHGSPPRAGSFVVHPLVPAYPGIDSRDHERVHGLRAYHQQQQSNLPSMPSHMYSTTRRPGGPRAHRGPMMSSADHARPIHMFPSSGSSGRNFHEVENPALNHLYAWEQDQFAPFPLVPVDRETCWWSSFHHNASGSDSTRPTAFWDRSELERPPQSRSDQSFYQPVHLSRPLFHFI
ncbi:hypothetical protein Sjap_006854 [Stephania japonica]|uniref:RING-type domain-containing protein n=1 Tax=Stephania japonica TaxID=461633 RepID=A0AAP0PN75_9MAGN